LSRLKKVLASFSFVVTKERTHNVSNTSVAACTLIAHNQPMRRLQSYCSSCVHGCSGIVMDRRMGLLQIRRFLLIGVPPQKHGVHKSMITLIGCYLCIPELYNFVTFNDALDECNVLIYSSHRSTTLHSSSASYNLSQWTLQMTIKHSILIFYVCEMTSFSEM